MLLSVACNNNYEIKNKVFISNSDSYFVWDKAPTFISNDSLLLFRNDYIVNIDKHGVKRSVCLSAYNMMFEEIWSRKWIGDSRNGSTSSNNDITKKLYLPLLIEESNLITLELSNKSTNSDTVAINIKTGEIRSKVNLKREVYSYFSYDDTYPTNRFWVDNSFTAYLSYEGKQLSFSLLKEDEVFLSDSMELESAAIYNKPTEDFPFLAIRGENSFSLFDLNQKINWTVDSLPYSVISTVSYEPDDSLIYLQHSNLYCINKNTGKLRFKSEADFKFIAGYCAKMDLKKWIYKDQILAIDYSSIGVFDRYSGKLKNLTKFDNEDISIEDATIFNNELVMITSEPVMFLRIPVEDLLIKKKLILSTEGFADTEI